MTIRHRPLTLLSIAALALALGACTTTGDDSAAQAQAAQAGNDVVSPAPAPEPASDANADAGDMAAQCSADAAQSFVGQQASDDIVAQAQAAAGAKGAVRVIKPGQPVTMDYRADRLNVEVDEQGAIVRISCG
ncbi:MAG TPA: I78 family peptidase inhibitor [Luteimonas sp.]|nr:I78 family peptidase inhibitor [Luteimonas sp.]